MQGRTDGSRMMTEVNNKYMQKKVYSCAQAKTSK